MCTRLSKLQRCSKAGGEEWDGVGDSVAVRVQQPVVHAGVGERGDVPAMLRRVYQLDDRVHHPQTGGEPLAREQRQAEEHPALPPERSVSKDVVQRLEWPSTRHNGEVVTNVRDV
jgi:hypothetical protein